jgi:hypothetical protein
MSNIITKGNADRLNAIALFGNYKPTDEAHFSPPVMANRRKTIAH